MIKQRLKAYLYLLRINKPIGIMLLLWPTLWALFIAANGHPPVFIVVIFIIGVILMRSAGCIINDYADRDKDIYVARTQNRPLAKGVITNKEAIFLFLLISIMAASLLIFLNNFVRILAVTGVILTIIYPYLKRITHLPQVFLGIVFGGWSVLMAFAQIQDHFSFITLLLFIIAMLWTISYDTIYAIVDRPDDIKVGIKSMAILLGNFDRFIIGILQLLVIILLLILGIILQFLWIYYLTIFISSCLFAYQQFLIKDRDPSNCFKAFLNNNWVGMVIFLGVFLNYFFSSKSF